MRKLMMICVAMMLVITGAAVFAASDNSPAQQCAAAGFGAGSPLHSACVVCVAQGLDLQGGGEVTKQCLCKVLVAIGEYPNMGACKKANP